MSEKRYHAFHPYNTKPPLMQMIWKKNYNIYPVAYKNSDKYTGNSWWSSFVIFMGHATLIKMLTRREWQESRIAEQEKKGDRDWQKINPVSY